jgi:hypothetical protein
MLKILNELGKPKITQQERKEIIHKMAVLIQQKSVSQTKGSSLIKSNLENLCKMLEKLEDNLDEFETV